MAFAAEPSSASTLLDRLEELFRAHVDAVYNVAYRVVWNPSDAEDVVQHTFVKVISRLDQVRDRHRVRPWLLQIAYREAIAVLRRRRDLPTDPGDLPDTPTGQPGPAEVAVSADVAAIVQRALEQMAPDERLALVLRDIEELSMSEVAEVLDIGLSAAKMRVHRGRASLRSTLSAAEVR